MTLKRGTHSVSWTDVVGGKIIIVEGTYEVYILVCVTLCVSYETSP